ncbi:MAG: HTH domain-containing protein [Clostridia bacterium]|nr:HTH domain-containing protein [Clostridia bacterium]
MDQPKIERLLRLIKMMSGHENYTIDQLAEKLGTSYRSIYRYIDTFKECGFVVLKLRVPLRLVTQIRHNHALN